MGHAKIRSPLTGCDYGLADCGFGYVYGCGCDCDCDYGYGYGYGCVCVLERLNVRIHFRILLQEKVMME